MTFRLSVSALTVMFSFCLACGDGEGDDAGMDAAGMDAGGVACTEDGECSDGLSCNGEERCVFGDDPAVGVCGAGTPPCGDGECDETTGECLSGCPDADGDGAADSDCGGSDCDDSDPLRFPGATEICDVDNRDEDCDGRTFGVRDADGDSSPDANCCNGDTCGDDCDDTRAAVNPLNPETCDGLDNDCDGMVDEGVLITFTVDADGDDFGSDADDAETMEACSAPLGFASTATDCNDDPDTGGGVNPGVPEDCNGGDEDCDGMVDEDCDCVVPSSRECPDALGVCATGNQTCVDGTWGDCSVTAQPETCDGADNDCDGTVDDGVGIACYADPDGDGFASSTAAVTMRCTCASNETDRAPTDATNTDCREAASGAADPIAARTFPGASEVCDGIDNDCSSDGGEDLAEDRDGDGFTAQGFAGCSGGDFPKTDCNDSNGTINPDAGYQATGYCTGNTRLCVCGGVPRCINAFSFCAGCGSSSGSAPSFEYNCDGITQAEPRRTGGCGPGGGATPCVGAGCGPSSTQPISNCGTNVTYSCCGGIVSCMTSTTTRPLRCR
ncbi:MAG: MopE-related protein [Sandaracinaceae bacterium]